jgi:hypothetical protein
MTRQTRLAWTLRVGAYAKEPRTMSSLAALLLPTVA